MAEQGKINIIVGFLVIATIVAGIFLGYQRYEQRRLMIEQKEAFIAAAEQATPDSPIEDNVRALGALREKYSAYENTGIAVEARRKYEELVEDLQRRIEKGYTSSIENLVIKDIDTTEDVDAISNMLRQLEGFITRVDADSSIVAKPTLTDDVRSQAVERVTQYKKRVTAIEEAAKRKAEEEAKRQAAEEERKKAEEQRKAEQAALTAALHYENEYFSLDFPPAWEGKWSVGRPADAGQTPSYRVIATGVANNPSGGGAVTLSVVCGMVDVENPALVYVGRTSDQPCRVFVRHDWGIGFINENNGIGEVVLTLK